MRSLASIVDAARPDVLAVCEIEPGDALSLATRFALQWAYRGRQALFWSARVSAGAVHDLYLPRAGRPFERRGLLRVNALLDGEPCALVATQFASGRGERIPELRFARSQLRAGGPTLLFAHLEEDRIAFEDLGFAVIASHAAERVYARGIAPSYFARVSVERV